MPNTGYKILLVCGLMVINFTCLQAQNQSDEQEWEKYSLDYRTIRVSVIPGLSTNGPNAVDYVSKYSLNIIAGYNGALHNGFELGGLVNANKYFAHGVQIAGLANYSGKETAGVQLAGMGNYSGDDMQGIQFAGIGNWSAENMQGLQFSGVFNRSGGESQGLQFSGVLNISGNSMQGLFGSGVGNITEGEMQGLLFAGGFNIAKDDMQGIAASGIVNYSESFQGISLSTVNYSKEFQGIQFGNINIAKEAQGIQVGAINYADEFEGVPVGLISYYGNGRKNIDSWINDSGFTNAGVKLGTHEIYNMISIGYNPLLDGNVWQLGWSIGRKKEYENHFTYSDFSYFKINEGNWTKDLNSIFKYRLLFGKNFDDWIKVYGGPTLNMLVSKVPESDDYLPYRLFDFGAKGRQYAFWIGASLGIELF